MKEFRKNFQEYVAIGEEVNRHYGSVKNPHQDKEVNRFDRERFNKKARRDVTNVQTFAVNTPNSDTKRAPRPCLFCQGSHWMNDCTKLTRRDEREKKLADMDRCFKCLRIGHRSNQCTRQGRCRNCSGGNHHACICPNPNGSSRTNEQRQGNRFQKRDGNQYQKPKRQQSGQTQKQSQAVITSSATIGNLVTNPVILMTRRTTVIGKGGKADALIFFDPGSQVSFVRRDFARKIGATKLRNDVLNVYPFGNQLPNRMNTTLHELKLVRQDGETEEMQAFATDRMGSELVSASADGKGATVEHIRGTEAEPDVLIGIRDFWRFFRGRDETSPDALIIHTSLGDVLCGRWNIDDWASPNHHSRQVLVHAISATSQEMVPESIQVHDFWALETIGIRDDPKEDEDQAAIEAFTKSICRVDGRYIVSWAWKDENPDLPSNFGMAFSRLAAILRKLQAEPELAHKYDSIIKDQLEKNIIEPAEQNDGCLEHYPTPSSFHSQTPHRI